MVFMLFFFFKAVLNNTFKKIFKVTLVWEYYHATLSLHSHQLRKFMTLREKKSVLPKYFLTEFPTICSALRLVLVA